MSTVRIAHLSDLHFNRAKDFDVWKEVSGFLNCMNPHAIFITGDVTDNAEEDEFEYARQCLSQLNLNSSSSSQHYLIIPGNHDRFLYCGNTWKPWVERQWVKDKSGRFNRFFAGAMHVTPQNPCDLELGVNSGGPGWKIRVIGLDSSEQGKWFAQGAVSYTSIAAACRTAAANVDRDLVIVLVHHHVLPIPEAEREVVKKARLARGRQRNGTSELCKFAQRAVQIAREPSTAWP